MLALYADQDPKDWQFPDRSVLVDVYYALTDQPNLHHIFPLDFCEKVLGEEGIHADLKNPLISIFVNEINKLWKCRR